MPATEAPVPGAPPLVPGYSLAELLGSGGSGEVWRAVPRGGGPAVAVKLLTRGDADRQAREAALLGELDHPHLVRLREVVHPRPGDAGGRVALVLDLLEGGSLARLLASRGRLTPGEVVTAIAPVAAALAHAHEHGVVHGDLSPGNVVFTADGRPVLTDLGVGRVLGESAAGEVTPAYVDPTVARGGATGPASDVFGIAAAAFHALTGTAPWNAADPAGTLEIAAAGVLPDLDELAPDAPAELRAVLARGLSPEPHRRGSAAAFALDLRHACRPEPVRLTPVGSAHHGAGREPRTELTHQVPGRRHRPAPVVVGPPAPGRRSWRAWAAAGQDLVRGAALSRLPLRALTVAALIGGLALAAWLGARWGGTATPVNPAGAVAGPSANRSPAPAPAPATTAARDRTAAQDPVAGSSPSGSGEWSRVVTGLYAARARAFGTGDTGLLDEVYAGGGALRAADERYLADLAAGGRLLRGFDPQLEVVRTVEVDGDRAELRLVDRWPAYDVVSAAEPDGPALESVDGRPGTEVRMLLTRTAAGWRIATAERVG